MPGKKHRRKKSKPAVNSPSQNEIFEPPIEHSKAPLFVENLEGVEMKNMKGSELMLEPILFLTEQTKEYAQQIKEILFDIKMSVKAAMLPEAKGSDLPSSFESQLAKLIKDSINLIEQTIAKKILLDEVFNCPVTHVRFSNKANEANRALVAGDGHTYGASFLQSILDQDEKKPADLVIPKKLHSGMKPRNRALEEVADLMLEVKHLEEGLFEALKKIKTVFDLMLKTQEQTRKYYQEILQLVDPSVRNAEAEKIAEGELNTFAEILEKLRMAFERISGEQAKRSIEQAEEIASVEEVLRAQASDIESQERNNVERLKEVREQREIIEALKLKIEKLKETKEKFKEERNKDQELQAQIIKDSVDSKIKDAQLEAELNKKIELTKKRQEQAQRILELERQLKEIKDNPQEEKSKASGIHLRHLAESSSESASELEDFLKKLESVGELEKVINEVDQKSKKTALQQVAYQANTSKDALQKIKILLDFGARFNLTKEDKEKAWSFLKPYLAKIFLEDKKEVILEYQTLMKAHPNFFVDSSGSIEMTQPKKEILKISESKNCYPAGFQDHSLKVENSENSALFFEKTKAGKKDVNELTNESSTIPRK